jgi:uncharacterized membrane protein
MLSIVWMVADVLGYLLVALLVAILVILAFGRSFRRSLPSAEEILKVRYAQGELTRRQYEDQLEELRR